MIFLLTSCKKEATGYIIKNGSFPANNLTASSDSIVLTPAAQNDTAVTFSWSSADFGQKPVIAYTLQLDTPSDTSGTSGWAKAQSFTVGNNIVTYSFIGKELNSTLVSMGLGGGSANKIVVRIIANVPQNTGSASSIPAIYSNTLSLQVTPYDLSMYIPGAYQGWNPATAPLLNPVNGRAGLYEAYEYLNDYTSGGIQYFKYTNAQDWNHINYGDGGNGTFSTDGAAGGLSAPVPGYYELTANLNNNTWTATRTTWGILGDATPGGWNTDTQMSYDSVNQIWTVTCNMLQNGSFKFRANNEWVIDFGVDANGNLAYADNPFFGYNGNLNNLTVPSSGNYTIKLDLHISGVYKYSLTKN
jgi:hypothetical protein